MDALRVRTSISVELTRGFITVTYNAHEKADRWVDDAYSYKYCVYIYNILYRLGAEMMHDLRARHVNPKKTRTYKSKRSNKLPLLFKCILIKNLNEKSPIGVSSSRAAFLTRVSK